MYPLYALPLIFRDYSGLCFDSFDNKQANGGWSQTNKPALCPPCGLINEELLQAEWWWGQGVPS